MPNIKYSSAPKRQRQGRPTDASLIKIERERNDKQAARLDQLGELVEQIDQHLGVQAKAIDAIKNEIDGAAKVSRERSDDLADQINDSRVAIERLRHSKAETGECKCKPIREEIDKLNQTQKEFDERLVMFGGIDAACARDRERLRQVEDRCSDHRSHLNIFKKEVNTRLDGLDQNFIGMLHSTGETAKRYADLDALRHAIEASQRRVLRRVVAVAVVAVVVVLLVNLLF